jgi:hypothetical protein
MNLDPTVGRIIHFKASAEAPCQAAIVVKVWSPEVVNLQVFRDGTNDSRHDGHGADPTFWATSAQFKPSDQQGWHWPERESN